MALDIDTVLAPVDASDQGYAALDSALAVADRYDAALHVLHLVNESVARGLETGDIEPSAVADDHLAVMDTAEDRADDIPVSHSTAVGFSPSQLTQHPGSVILDVAEELDVDFIVVPRETPSGDPDEAIGKSALYVVEYASQPVLSV